MPEPSPAPEPEPETDHRLSYHFTRTFSDPRHCADCKAGTCVQRVTELGHGSVRVDHGAQRGLS